MYSIHFSLIFVVNYAFIISQLIVFLNEIIRNKSIVVNLLGSYNNHEKNDLFCFSLLFFGL